MEPMIHSPIKSFQSRSAASVDHIKHLLAFGRPRQVLVPGLGDENVVLDPHTADVPVFAQHLLIDVLGVDGVPEEVALNVLAAEVAGKGQSYPEMKRGEKQKRMVKEGRSTHMPGSIVTIMFFSNLCLPPPCIAAATPLNPEPTPILSTLSR